MRINLLLAGVAATALASPAFSQTAPAPRRAQAPAAPVQEIVISAPLRQSEADILQGTSVVAGEELQRDLRPSIGETLARQPGVSATSFGPTASRPILRGFQGERIRVLSDGIGSIDVSNTSVDHAVVIDPLLAERVEVLRGPSALLFGSSAIGGVVNVIDTRIPRSIPAEGYRVNGIANYASAANERSGAAAGDVALGGKFVLHADGSYAKSDDLRIPGYALSGSARAQAIATSLLPQPIPAPGEEPIDFAANAAIRDRLPNTAAETWTAGVGGSLITDSGSLGIAYSHYDSRYGVPLRYATGFDQEQEAPRIDIAQDRYDLRGQVDTGGGFLQQIRLRAAHATYRHFELEEDDSVGTAFYNKGLEGRLELVQAKQGAWLGASGVQYFHRAFDVEGDEAFLPRNQTSQLGLFTLQQLDLGAFKAEAGARYERTDLHAQTLAGDLRFFGGKRQYDAFSASAGASYAVAPSIRIGFNLSRTERAPSAEELFANGPHAGTQAYELGDPNLRLEKSWGAELTAHATSDGFHFDASAYYNWFSDYVFESQVDQSVCEAAAAPSGRDVDLPCFHVAQADARYYGIEGDASLRLATIGDFELHGDVLGDYVHATIVDQGPVPRIPPARLLGGLEAQSDRLNARVEVERVFTQDRTAAFETRTSGYTMLNASLQFSPWGKAAKTSFLLSANNILDTEARRHSSFLKDFAPLAGRDIRLSLRFGF